MGRLFRLLIFFAFFFGVCLWTGRKSVAAPADFDHSHGAFTRILQSHVVYKNQTSEVNYLKLRTAMPDLEKYLATLTAVKTEQFKTFSPAEQKAFLINAYNGFTL